LFQKIVKHVIQAAQTIAKIVKTVTSSQESAQHPAGDHTLITRRDQAQGTHGGARFTDSKNSGTRENSNESARMNYGVRKRNGLTGTSSKYGSNLTLMIWTICTPNNYPLG
jgi:hypothetical protein